MQRGYSRHTLWGSGSQSRSVQRAGAPTSSSPPALLAEASQQARLLHHKLAQDDGLQHLLQAGLELDNQAHLRWAGGGSGSGRQGRQAGTGRQPARAGAAATGAHARVRLPTTHHEQAKDGAASPQRDGVRVGRGQVAGDGPAHARQQVGGPQPKRALLLLHHAAKHQQGKCVGAFDVVRRRGSRRREGGWEGGHGSSVRQACKRSQVSSVHHMMVRPQPPACCALNHLRCCQLACMKVAVANCGRQGTGAAAG